MSGLPRPDRDEGGCGYSPAFLRHIHAKRRRLAEEQRRREAERWKAEREALATAVATAAHEAREARRLDLDMIAAAAAERRREALAYQLPLAPAALRFDPEKAPQLAAATCIREAFERPDGIGGLIGQPPEFWRRVEKRLRQAIMIECAIVHLVGRWCGEDGTYRGSPLELSRLLAAAPGTGGCVGASFVASCLGALGQRRFVERIAPPVPKGAAAWRLTDDGRALRRGLVGEDRHPRRPR